MVVEFAKMTSPVEIAGKRTDNVESDFMALLSCLGTGRTDQQ